MKKAELNRFCAIGELVVKHFPGLNSLDPGKSQHNKRSLREKGDFTLFKIITIQSKKTVS
ncbi:MAG: hypothetical protein MSH60_09975 [Ruminococcus sp.]|nr:hypothetical protein [Ruminococcus sp.]